MGLIGGSLLAAGRARRLFARATGADTDAAACRAAVASGLVASAGRSAAAAAAGADLLVLATPVEAMADALREALPHLRPGAVVTDVGSVKGPVAEALGPLAAAAGVAFVPGHPVAGTERQGLAAAQADLFTGRRVVLTPRPDAPPAAVARVRALWEGLGATVTTMEPAAHDAAFAALSHLPHVAVYALLAAIAADPGLAATAPELAGGGLRDTTRIGASSPALWRGICLANRGPLLAALGGLEAQLARCRTALEAEDGAALEAVFAQAKALRDRIG
jgi:prephenate dehydrogenase